MYILIYVFRTLQYIEKNNKESFFTVDTVPDSLYKKKTLLEYFHNYMHEHLLKVCSFLLFSSLLNGSFLYSTLLAGIFIYSHLWPMYVSSV